MVGDGDDIKNIEETWGSEGKCDHLMLSAMIVHLLVT